MRGALDAARPPQRRATRRAARLHAGRVLPSPPCAPRPPRSPRPRPLADSPCSPRCSSHRSRCCSPPAPRPPASPPPPTPLPPTPPRPTPPPTPAPPATAASASTTCSSPPTPPPPTPPPTPASTRAPHRSPDLLRPDKLTADIWLDERDIPPDDCAVVEGCIDQPGKRLLLRFGVVTANIGDTDLQMGRPEGSPELFEYSGCHEHYHFERYADYRLMSGEDTVSVGRKQAFCLMDTERYLEDDPTVRDQARYRCAFQGISRGWQDTYHSRLDCQWIDVTDVAPGRYDLAVRINPDHVITEKTYDNNDATARVEVPPYDIAAACPPDSREDSRRACGWTLGEVGRCAQGDVVEIGCGGCGDHGPACMGDPMLRVCDGEMTQCLPSSALAQASGGCDDSPCPHVEFVCPEGGIFTVWTAPTVDATPYACAFTTLAGPPRLEEPCQDGEDGLERTCGWHRAAELDGECLPGFAYAVGCNPDGTGDDPACGLGAACEGDPMLRVCPDDAPCLPVAALAQDDDACDTWCPATTFECPPSGRYSVWHGAYRSERDYACTPAVRRLVD
ncbi:MAG: lysyl oxidase family protein [bacterium]